MGRNVIGADEPPWGPIEHPRPDHREGKAGGERHDNQPHDPRRRIEERESLRGYLDQEPRNRGVANGRAIDVASPQFSEKVV